MGLDIVLFKTKAAEVANFRKVNFLFKFFEDKIGDRNPTIIEVTTDDLCELRDRCSKVLTDHTLAEELLPTCSGFFFGSTEYNKDYYKDVLQVLDVCESLLKQPLDDGERYELYVWY